MLINKLDQRQMYIATFLDGSSERVYGRRSLVHFLLHYRGSVVKVHYYSPDGNSEDVTKKYINTGNRGGRLKSMRGV